MITRTRPSIPSNTRGIVCPVAHVSPAYYVNKLSKFMEHDWFIDLLFQDIFQINQHERFQGSVHIEHLRLHLPNQMGTIHLNGAIHTNWRQTAQIKIQIQTLSVNDSSGLCCEIISPSDIGSC